MSRRRLRQSGRGALELIEEATHLLRLAPAQVLAAYYSGTLPFVLGLLYFWADMSRGAFAWRHCSQAALTMALLYLWMKCWQAVFAHQLHARLCRHRPARWSPARVARLIATQALVQSTGLFVLPVAALITLPFGWAYSFYHNASVFGAGGASTIQETVRRSWRQASLWPGQNHGLMAVLWLFGLFVFGNASIGIGLLPALLKMFLGIETTFTMSPSAMLNTTFLAATGSITYLCVNPLIKTVYVLRCFYGESLQTGEDLKAELQSLVAAAAALVILLFAFPMPAAAATQPDRPSADPELSTQLDRSINEVINKPEYTWRQPREKAPPQTEKNLLTRFLDSVLGTISNVWRTVHRFLKRVADWLDEWARRWWINNHGEERTGVDWISALHILYFGLMTIVVVALTILFWRVWKQRTRRPIEAVGEPVLPALDLTDETLIADQLPSEGWLARARELMAAGDLRLALRALYLASLAHLSQRELIAIARFKSNREYERELRRRARTRADLIEAFSQNVTTFESAWYGMHEVTREILDGFTANCERIRSAS